jgi:Major Facilitator Superfamily
MSGIELVRIDTNILPKAKLLVVFAGLAFALLVAFIDQNSIGIALPTIGADLHAATTISWAGTSSLIANTVIQVLYGHLSDILGRKVVFLSSIGLLALGGILCGFSRTASQLYAFRGIAGVGTGGIIALAMMIVSDIVTLENRGKYAKSNSRVLNYAYLLQISRYPWQLRWTWKCHWTISGCRIHSESNLACALLVYLPFGSPCWRFSRSHPPFLQDTW